MFLSKLKIENFPSRFLRFTELIKVWSVDDVSSRVRRTFWNPCTLFRRFLYSLLRGVNRFAKCIPKIRLVPFTLQKRFHLDAVLLKRQFPTKEIQVKIPALQLFPKCSHAALQLIHHRGLNRERERERERERQRRRNDHSSSQRDAFLYRASRLRTAIKACKCREGRLGHISHEAK